ncbi:MAG: MgtC/SapB family protein [Oscillospiraceae bacterium]
MIAFFEQHGLLHITEQAIVLRILLAIILGGMVGFERTYKGHSAGFRTHILVCLSATVIMMTGQYVFEYTGVGDAARLGAQVVNGIGFLGAGTIMVTGAHQIKGLTTAATLWSAAGLGLAIGIGFYFAAVCACIAIMVVISLFDNLQDRLVSFSGYMRIHVVFKSVDQIGEFLQFCKNEDIVIDDFQQMNTEKGVSGLFKIQLKKKIRHSEVVEMLRACDGIVSAEEY